MSENEKREFRSELISRRGEWTAWGLALAASLGMWFLNRSGYIPVWAWIFWAFLLFSGVSISLGNWLDRNSVIWLETDGIRFENGLRRVRLRWPEVQKVAVLPSRWGKSVQVIGEKSQIIMITHNKKSMEFADTLFGVTMEHKGISKIVSVNLQSKAA